jgi:hypothetical protein
MPSRGIGLITAIKEFMGLMRLIHAIAIAAPS